MLPCAAMLAVRAGLLFCAPAPHRPPLPCAVLLLGCAPDGHLATMEPLYTSTPGPKTATLSFAVLVCTPSTREGDCKVRCGLCAPAALACGAASTNFTAADLCCSPPQLCEPQYLSPRPQAFQQCVQQLRQTGQGFLVEEQLPVHGVGHSNGALLHLLIGSQFPVTNRSNILMSFNNQ